MDRWTGGWMDGWVDGRVDGRTDRPAPLVVQHPEELIHETPPHAPLGVVRGGAVARLHEVHLGAVGPTGDVPNDLHQQRVALRFHPVHQLVQAHVFLRVYAFGNVAVSE